MTDDGAPRSPQLFGLTVPDLLARTADRTPEAGGGAMAVLACSASAALVTMAARFAGAVGEPILADVEPRSAELMTLADADAAGFDALLAAWRLPSEDPARAGAIAKGVRLACEVPLRVCEIGALLSEQALVLAEAGKPDLEGDALVAMHLARAAVEGSAQLVRLNTAAFDDPALSERAVELVEQTRRAMRRLSPERQ